MKMSFKVLVVSSLLVLTSACQDTLDTSSHQAKEQSIKQMMVGIYPLNQKNFKKALKAIYLNDSKINPNLSKEQVMALSNKKLEGKTVEEILHLSFVSNKEIKTNSPEILVIPNTVVVSNTIHSKKNPFIKSHLITK